MEDHNNRIGSLSPAFDQSGHSTGNDSRSKANDVPVQLYALNDGAERYFDLILKSGREYSIPYALLPVYVLTGESTIFITAYNYRITIQGRNLKRIRNFLKKETLKYLRESPSGKDSGEGDLFISKITVEETP